MTTRTIAAPTAGPEPFVVLPDPPRLDMLEFPHVSRIMWILETRYSHLPDVVIMTQGYLCFDTGGDRSGWLAPDCLVSFGASMEVAKRRHGYVIAEQGKPPDFVLEVASESTGRRDYTVKREGYAAFGVTEYFRFDDTGGRYHDRPLAGDRLVDGAYEPIPTTTDDAGNLRAYSETLGLHLCWENGRLRLWNPDTGAYLDDYDEARQAAHAQADAAHAQADAAEARADAAEDAHIAAEGARIAAEAERDRERDARIAAEAELRRLRERLDT